MNLFKGGFWNLATVMLKVKGTQTPRQVRYQFSRV